MHTYICKPYFVAFWNPGALAGQVQLQLDTFSFRFASLQRKWLQERPFRHPKVFLQGHPQHTFTYDCMEYLYTYSAMHCWAKLWVGPYLMGCAAVETTYLNRTILHQISSLIVPHNCSIAAWCSTMQCGCRKHWLACTHLQMCTSSTVTNVFTTITAS